MTKDVRVRVAGAGLFGCTAAIHLKRAGYDVEIHERREGLFKEATAHNQFRLHRGYHYPRSPATGRQCRQGNESFYGEYGDAILHPLKSKQVYAIAREGSKTGPGGFDSFCRQEGLPAEIIEVREPLLNPDMVDMAWSVWESRVDPVKLLQIVERHLDALQIPVHFNSPMGPEPESDFIDVYCTYSPSDGAGKYRWQVVEKPVFRLPKIWSELSVVVVDGPFCCVDPIGTCGMSVMGHVTKAVHWEAPYAPENAHKPFWWQEHLNRGIRHLGDNSRWSAMLADAEQYMPFVGKADYQGSLLTVRCVMDHPDDARPTVVSVEGERQLRVFSGKLGTCVDAARDVVRKVRSIENGG